MKSEETLRIHFRWNGPGIIRLHAHDNRNSLPFGNLRVETKAAWDQGGGRSLAMTPFVAGPHLRAALFSLGAAALLLLFVGIHNAWDAVTYHVFENKPTS